MDDTDEKIKSMIDNVISGDLTQANSTFDDLMGDRVSSTLDQHKIAIANSLYGEQEDDDLEQEYDDFEQEDNVED
jgi:hypothetical protein